MCRNSGTSAERIEAGKTWVDKRYTVTFVQPNGEQLGIIAQLIADGKVKPVVEQVIPLDKARYDHVSRCKAVILMIAS